MSHTLLAVDPGIRGCGAAVFIETRVPYAKSTDVLWAASYVPNSAEEGAGPAEAALCAQAVIEWVRCGFARLSPSMARSHPLIDTLVIEWPQTYGGRAKKGDANDLLPLCAVDGALSALCSGTQIVYRVPHDWKGSVPKPTSTSKPYIIQERVKARLSEAERVRVVWPGNKKLGWDVADAIGIGLHYLGRFERQRGRGVPTEI